MVVKIVLLEHLAMQQVQKIKQLAAQNVLLEHMKKTLAQQNVQVALGVDMVYV